MGHPLRAGTATSAQVGGEPFLGRQVVQRAGDQPSDHNVRRSQGGKRGDLDIIEINDGGLIKINPLANWTFAQVKEYIDANNVPYNDLLNQGYKSVGDWHSTQPVAAGEDERAGRWKGRNKTECGIHNPKSKYAQFLKEQELKAQQEALEGALQKLAV